MNLVIRKVKKSLREEKEAVKGYRQDAKKMDKTTAKLMRRIARDEVGHKQLLQKRLKAVERKTKLDIKAALKDEAAATKGYRRAAKHADPKTAKLFRHIAKQEVHHHKELNERLKQLKKLK